LITKLKLRFGLVNERYNVPDGLVVPGGKFIFKADKLSEMTSRAIQANLKLTTKEVSELIDLLHEQMSVYAPM
jgi:hypothetical protein